jgi:Protein of unknown function (DUF2851)
LKSNGKVCSIRFNPYAAWRLQDGQVPLRLREPAPLPREELLQLAWQHQRLRRTELTLLDGRSLQVLHPGFRNREAGPDFREAVLRVAEDAPRSGDVEIDLHSGGWRGHHHDRNPAFGRVILHVVWEGDAHPTLPTLRLKDRLDSPVEELARWLNTESSQLLPDDLLGMCAAPLAGLNEERLGDVLHQAARVRLEGKARQFQARARLAGWDQALWEGIFRALGYKHNAWPMQYLAESKDHLLASECSLAALQARLLGSAGLLPRDLSRTRRAGDRYLRELWDQWWRDQAWLDKRVLPGSLWQAGGLRPSNHPARRLALAAHWLLDDRFIAKLEGWGLALADVKKAPSNLLKLLQWPRDAFWSWHWTLRSERFKKPQTLIGPSRTTDLAMNVILPWLWMRAREGKEPGLSERIEGAYLSWPAAQDNAVLKLARQRLLGRSKAPFPAGAAAQQGLMQIVRDFCAYSNSLCQQCRFPDFMRQWNG